MSSPTPAGTAPSRTDFPSHLHGPLQQLGSRAYRRGKRGGWIAASAPTVSADAVSQLAVRNLVKVTAGRFAHHDVVEVTDLGLEALATLRAARKAQAEVQ